MSNKGPASKKKKQRPAVAAYTPQSLRRSAMGYIERYDCSTAGLVEVLKRKIYRSSRLHKIDVDELTTTIPDIIEECQNKNWIYDQRYAENLSRSLFRRGSSLQSIRFKLLEKGVEHDIAEQTIEALAQESSLSKQDIDLAAAISYAQKRRMGPFRLDEADESKRNKELGALARRGFSFEIAEKVLSTDREELEEIIEEFKRL